MKFIGINELNLINPLEECFVIKNFIPKEWCESIINFLKLIKNSHLPNQRYSGDNWYYIVNKNETYFDSFIFNELFNIKCEQLVETYQKLFQLYKLLGEELDGDWQTFLFNNAPANHKTINPLIFSYPAGIGKFEPHQHPDIFQKFQLLINLTEPGLDYKGGFTHIQMNDKKIDTFDHNFKQGDLFSFPYNKWHSVDPILDGCSTLNSRISLLMPLHPRSGIQTNYNSESEKN